MSIAGNQQDRIFDVGEVRLHAVVCEPQDRAPRGTIVMLHGFPEFWALLETSDRGIREGIPGGCARPEGLQPLR